MRLLLDLSSKPFCAKYFEALSKAFQTLKLLKKNLKVWKFVSLNRTITRI